MARPTRYSAELARSICDLGAKGTPVHRIAAKPGMPAESAIFEWLSIHPEFAEQYTRAREALAHRFAAEVISIADAAPETIKGVEKAALRTRNRIWAAERMAPKKYGARQVIDHSSSDRSMSPAPVAIIIEGAD